MSEVVCVTRKYRFSAGHRLYIPGLSDEENRRIFDTCSNPNGHGHDYALDITVRGDIDEETGMVVSPEELDGVTGPVIGELDYKRLDVELPYFTDRPATGENIAAYIWEKLWDGFGGRLVHIKLSETPSSYFEYFEEDNYPYER